MKRVVVTRSIPEAGLRMLRARGIDLWVSPQHHPLARRALLRAVRGANAILTQLVDRVDAELMEAAGSSLRVVANYAVGYDNVDLAAARARGIWVCNTPDVSTDAVADHTFALLLAVARRVVESDRFARSGRYHGWAPDLLLGQGITGGTLGIVGSGRIGRAVAERARGFRMRVLYHDRTPNRAFERAVGAEYRSLRSLLSGSDAVTLHVPLTPATRHLIGPRQLGWMRPNAILINTARGPVVDESALIRAVGRGGIFGAGLDVFECEPEITCDVTSHRLLSRLPSIVLTPHTASATVQARAAMAVVAARSIRSALAGRVPRTVVR